MDVNRIMYMSVLFPLYTYGQMNSMGRGGGIKERKKEIKNVCDEFKV